MKDIHFAPREGRSAGVRIQKCCEECLALRKMYKIGIQQFIISVYNLKFALTE
jgi:hypothetical protein